MSTARPASLGRYVIEGELGRGAMGVVYRARDPRIDRPIALKTLYPPRSGDHSAAALKERFLNEGRAAGRLSHRGIVAVYDADEDAATGIAYLAMELVEGTDLRELVRNGLTPRDLVELLVEVADALDHAHQRGVVHRDVKPANILIDSNGRPHLTDFGIARLGDSTLTQDGEFLGTPAYMAPEQVRSKPVTARTDVYGLGVVAYEALTGARPFGGDSMVATATAIAVDEPPRPSAIAPIAEHFDAPILRALSKNPDARQASAGAFASELRTALQAAQRGAPPPKVEPGRPGSTPGDAVVRRGPWIGLVAAAVVSVVVLLLLVRRDEGPPTTPPDPDAKSTVSSREAPPPARGEVVVSVKSSREGRLVVSDGSRRLATLDIAGRARDDRDKAATLSLPAGARTLTFAYTLKNGDVLTATAPLDIPKDGRLAVTVDVGALGRKIEVKLPR